MKWLHQRYYFTWNPKHRKIGIQSKALHWGNFTVVGERLFSKHFSLFLWYALILYMKCIPSIVRQCDPCLGIPLILYLNCIENWNKLKSTHSILVFQSQLFQIVRWKWWEAKKKRNHISDFSSSWNRKQRNNHVFSVCVHVDVDVYISAE